jgi:apolipoprotein D and lipocalin family protein
MIGGVLLAAATLTYAFAERRSNLKAVPYVDLNRYTGRWYEIARYSNRFQRQCVGNVTATYSLLPNGKIEVVNECRKADGKLVVARGKAKVAEKTSTAKLRVTFFWPFSGDYWVIVLDPEYRWAVVGEPDRKYLWILSRTPQLPAADYDQAISAIRAKGYDPSKLLLTPQLP